MHKNSMPEKGMTAQRS